jgi:prephenate dehydrogenase
MWRDVALTNKQSIAEALLKLEQRLAHIRENLDTRQLEEEFNLAHKLKSPNSPRRHGDAEKNKKKETKSN